MKSLFTILFFIISNPSYCQPPLTVVHFDFNKYEITPESKRILDSLFNSSSGIRKIDLYGHCDSLGNNDYNDLLSEKRVNTVKNYLLLKGIPAYNFKTLKGEGKRQPLNTNKNEDLRAINRRVEIFLEYRKEPDIRVSEIKTEKTLNEKIRDKATIEGSTLILKNINFFGDRHVTVPAAKIALDELVDVLKQNPTLEIEVQGHVCCTSGTEDALDVDTRTQTLSITRAQMVYNYLIEHGINSKRLSYQGFGHSHPLMYPEDTEQKRAMNRRVEIKIIKK